MFYKHDYCHNMSESQNKYWEQHDLSSVCFGLSDDMEHSLKELQQQPMITELNANIALSPPPSYPDTCRQTSDNMFLHSEGDQVVPSSQRQALFGGHQREAKPLPPLPDPEELMSDEATDCEVEFFTSDRRRLLPKSSPKAVCRSSNRDSGLVNYAYQERSLRYGGAGIGSVAFSWPSREEGGIRLGAWSMVHPGDHKQELAAPIEDTFRSKQLDQHQSRFQFSFPSSALPSHSSTTPSTTDRPQIPPRIPIPPKPPALSKTVNCNEEDRPPKIPPRVPLVPPCPPRSPSPKSLPIYINGVMPATQSFAANPKYVSKALQKQQSEGEHAAAQFAPHIVPILKDGRQASATHYILLPPGRPPYTERRERLLSEPTSTGKTRTWLKR
ncbi:ERBB receptor feedback inhibitor 1 [Pholidichthys leucotaenia]